VFKLGIVFGLDFKRLYLDFIKEGAKGIKGIINNS